MLPPVARTGTPITYPPGTPAKVEYQCWNADHASWWPTVVNLLVSLFTELNFSTTSNHTFNILQRFRRSEENTNSGPMHPATPNATGGGAVAHMQTGSSAHAASLHQQHYHHAEGTYSFCLSPSWNKTLLFWGGGGFKREIFETAFVYPAAARPVASRASTR